MGKSLIHGVFELQYVITYFQFGSDTKLRIKLSESQKRLCIGECHMDCDFNTNIDMFSCDSNSLRFQMHEFTISRISYEVGSLIQWIYWSLPQLAQNKTQISGTNPLLILLGLYLTINVSPYTLILFWKSVRMTSAYQLFSAQRISLWTNIQKAVSMASASLPFSTHRISGLWTNV